MSELMKAVAAAWNPETACKTRKEEFIYIGDCVTVARGRKIPQGTCGRVLRMFENPYDPITYENAKVQLELEDGNKVYTYLRNLEKTGV